MRGKPAWAAAVLLMAGSLAAAPWFDAGVADLADWPDDGSDVTVPSMGVWQGTAGAARTGIPGASRLNVDTLFTRPVAFAATPKNAEDGHPLVSTRVRFTACQALPRVDPTAKGALTVVSNAVDGCHYWGLVKDTQGTSNVWTRLDGVAPVFDRDVELQIFVWHATGDAQIKYVVDDGALGTVAGEWNAIAFPDGGTKVSSVGYAGKGDVAALSGEVDASPPRIRLSVPPVTGATFAVMVGEEAVAADENGRYLVPMGAPVKLVFTPEKGWALSQRQLVLTAGEHDMEVPVERLPRSAVASTMISITELMASNGETLRTAGGVAGLDWVEVCNTGDFDVDIAGWLITDDPTKKFSKWKTIDGRAVVPAGGRLVVWLDSDFADWHANDAHAALGLSASGEAIALATPDEEKLCEFAFGPQQKDVSFGYGRRVRRLVSTTSAAEYRVGGGEWRRANGPVGMSASGAGFTVVSCRMNSTVSTVDAAKAFLADPSKWVSPPVTNVCPTLAFADGGTVTNFAPYAAFPGVGGDNFVLKATGVVHVPRAGRWSFAVGSDDGFAAKLARQGDAWSWESPGTRGYSPSVATFNLPETGAYNVEIVYFDCTSSAALDFSVAEGEHAFDAGLFRLVGSAASGVEHAGAFASLIAVDVADEMRARATSLDWRASFVLDAAPAAGDAFILRMRYGDGFTASIGGVEFARAAVNGARLPGEMAQPVEFAIPSALLHAGTNTLLITGHNDSAFDESFLLAPEVIARRAAEELVYFKDPTPGAPNAAEGFSAPTPQVSFSVPHGYKTAPITLELSCADAPEAAIFYTTDGTSPTTASARYEGPITIASTTVVRAAVPDETSVLQQDTSATYLFLDDILRQGSTPPSNFPADRAVNGQHMLYGLNTAITGGDAATRRRLLNGFTNSIRTVSLVVDPANLFDATRGIYVNASGNGRDWERVASVEQISPLGGAADEFSILCGLRIRGGASRASGYAKHAFRLFFRGDYGNGKLEFPLFGEEGAGSFDKIDLRCSQNFAWANGSADETFIHEVFSRDSQRDMGQPYNRSRYYNLFINGVYWGVYQTEERVDQYYAETYNGGEESHYDVVRTSQPGYNTGVVEGEADAWNALWNITMSEGFTGAFATNYNRLCGRDAVGVRDPSLPVYLNPTNLIDFMLTVHFTGDKDSPSNGGMANNVIAYRDRVDGEARRDGFLFNRHDAEWTLGFGDPVDGDTTRRGTCAVSSSNAGLANFNPAALHYELCSNPEYRMLFADLVYEHCLRPGGAMTPARCAERFRSRMAELDDAIVCEAARWGRGRTYADWTNNCAKCLDYIANRTPYLIASYRANGWYPSIDAPTLEHDDGASRVHPRSAGTVWYTTDGSDPRLTGGAVSAAAVAADANGVAVPPQGLSLTMRARAANGEWSALVREEVEGTADPAFATPREALRVVEVMSATPDEGGDGREYIVFTNLSVQPLPLGGVRVTAAKYDKKKGTIDSPKCDFTFGNATIAPGGTLRAARSDYWSGGKITNGAVEMRVYDAGGAVVQSLYIDADWWNGACDCTGASFLSLTFDGEVRTETQWRPSFLPSSDTTVQEAFTAATAADDSVRTWLNALAMTSAGAAAIESFRGDAAALRACWLVDAPPETNPDIEVRIPSIAVDAWGRVRLGGRLFLQGVESARAVNGEINLYHAETLESLPTTTNRVPLGRAFPVPEQELLPATPARFFQLRVE